MPNRRKDPDDRLIVRRELSLETIKLPCEGPVSLEQPRDPHASPHDLDIYRDGMVAVKQGSRESYAFAPVYDTADLYGIPHE